MTRLYYTPPLKAQGSSWKTECKSQGCSVITIKPCFPDIIWQMYSWTNWDCDSTYKACAQTQARYDQYRVGSWATSLPIAKSPLTFDSCFDRRSQLSLSGWSLQVHPRVSEQHKLHSMALQQRKWKAKWVGNRGRAGIKIYDQNALREILRN